MKLILMTFPSFLYSARVVLLNPWVWMAAVVYNRAKLKALRPMGFPDPVVTAAALFVIAAELGALVGVILLLS